MNWQQPVDDFDLRLAAAREAILANRTDPWKAVELFEPILEELRYQPDIRDRWLPPIRRLGREMFEVLGSSREPVAMEVRHYCWHLQSLGDWGPSSILDMLMVTLNRFAHYASHEVDCCSICAEYPMDLPHQGSSEGRAHFNEWLRQRGENPDA
jgi:hypothetical protein